jgi:hypothetical protein
MLQYGTKKETVEVNGLHTMKNKFLKCCLQSLIYNTQIHDEEVFDE